MSPEDGVRRLVERSLGPVVLPNGFRRASSLAQRMKRFRVPGVGVAVVRAGALSWAASYGVLRENGNEAIDSETQFRAASISKLVSAIGALTLSSRGLLDLDADVNKYLASWRLPGSLYTQVSPVTMRRILSHTGGLNVPRVRGYCAERELVPTVHQVLEGCPPAKNDPVCVVCEPGTKFMYSEGGVTVEQLALADVADQAFHEFMAKTVLGPLGMEHSTFCQPLPPAVQQTVARGHDYSGRAEECLPVFPESAASGLWTTPSDLVRAMTAVRDAFWGSRRSLLSQSVAREMLTPSGLGDSRRDFGLGPWVSGRGGVLHFGHAGVSSTSKAIALLFLTPGDGAVVMTSGARGDHLGAEILATLAEAYSWPGGSYERRKRSVVELSEHELKSFCGRYVLVEASTGVMTDAFTAAAADIAISRQGKGLCVDTVPLGPELYYAESPTKFFNSEVELGLTFERDIQSRPTGLSIYSRGRLRGRAIRKEMLAS